MTETKAFQVVLDKLCEIPLFVGKYDAEHGKEHYMYGIASVMESIAYSVSEEVGEAFSTRFAKNMVASEQKACRAKLKGADDDSDNI